MRFHRTKFHSATNDNARRDNRQWRRKAIAALHRTVDGGLAAA
jgi:hypothetical protein